MIEIKIDLHKDFISLIMKQIPILRKMGFNFQTYKSWQKENGNNYTKFETEQLMSYANLMQKIPPQIPRKIFRCDDFICPSNYRTKLNILEQKIKQGDMLLPYLSRKIVNPLYCDEMLYDFGIIHFHFGEEVNKKNKIFIEGSKEILYAFIDNDECYFIEINDHNQFNNISLLKKLKNSFPNVLDKWRLNNVIPVTSISNEDRIKLRKKHVNTMIELDGEYFVSPGWGMSTAGTSPIANLNLADSIVIMKNYKTILLYLSKITKKILKRR